MENSSLKIFGFSAVFFCFPGEPSNICWAIVCPTSIAAFFAPRVVGTSLSVKNLLMSELKLGGTIGLSRVGGEGQKAAKS